ncbi:hypothetical protein ACKVEX_02835 [Rhodocyclaceae bacterium SMB388]
MSEQQPGRTCPIRYRYGPAAIARTPAVETETLYVIGGLYGNLPALDAVERLAAAENGPVVLCFNGDFNWFDVDEPTFRQINMRVLRHDALAGNVEAELASSAAGDDCGCAYPDSVDDAIVERSNRIHARLKRCASLHPHLRDALARLPMFARYRIGSLDVGVVHGDAESLAGWRFDASTLDAPGGLDWLADAARQADVDVFASSHTCLPALRTALCRDGRIRAVINNGAAGMPNLRGTHYGIISRIGTTPSPHPPLYGESIEGVHVDALAVEFDPIAWIAAFVANWPEGSDAWQSYFRRLVEGPDWSIPRAAGRQSAIGRLAR